MANKVIKKAASAGTFTISSDEKKLQVLGTVNGGTFNIDGGAADFKVSVKNGVITLTETDKDTNLSSITFKLAATGSATLKFIDGSLTITSAAGVVSVGGTAVGKGLDLASLTPDSSNAYDPDGGSTSTSSTFTLTTGINEINGTSANELIDATEILVNGVGTAALSAMDNIDGGQGTDTLKVVQSGAINTTTIAGLTVTGVENIDLKSAAAITADTTTWTGAANLTAVTALGVNATAAATTDINVTSTAAANNEILTSGGDDVTVTARGFAAVAATPLGGIAVTGATGNVVVNVTGAAANVAGTTATNTGIAVTGGKTVTVNQLAANAVATTVTHSEVSVTGGATTTAVTVNNAAAATAAAAVAGVSVGAAVAITDSATAGADTISTVTLKNFGATTITSSALTTLNVTGGATGLASGALTLNAQSTTTPATTLTVNAAGGSIGAIGGTQAAAYTAVNVASSADTTIANLSLAANKTLTVSGAGVTTLTAFTAANNAGLTSIVSNGGGLTIGTELAAGVAVTGGNGVETISVGQTTKAINLGGGNDVVTISNGTLGAGGSVNGGSGTNTIVANTNGSSIIANPAFANFSTLRVAGGNAQGAHNAAGFTALELGGTAAAVSSFTNVAAGAGLTVLAAPGGAHTVTLANATGTADAFNLTLSNATNAAQLNGSFTVAGVETVNVRTTDAGTGDDAAATIDTVTLVTNAAKTITVAGNNGLNITNDAGNTAVTSFDASGVVADSASTVDTAANLAVTYASLNATVAEAVSIKGGAGNDSLNVTGGALTNDTIYGNAGVDTIGYAGGSDVFYGGAGNDVFDINALGTSTVFATIADLAAGDTIDFDSIDTALGNDTFNATKVTLGGAATLAQYLDAASAGTGAVNSIIRWFQFGGDTYVTLDNTAGATFAATDSVVKITGLVDLSASTEANNILTIVAA